MPFINPYTFKGEIFHSKLREFIFFKLEEMDGVSLFLWNSIFFLRNLHIFGRFPVRPVMVYAKKMAVHISSYEKFGFLCFARFAIRINYLIKLWWLNFFGYPVLNF